MADFVHDGNRNEPNSMIGSGSGMISVNSRTQSRTSLRMVDVDYYTTSGKPC